MPSRHFCPVDETYVSGIIWGPNHRIKEDDSSQIESKTLPSVATRLAAARGRFGFGRMLLLQRARCFIGNERGAIIKFSHAAGRAACLCARDD